MANSLTINTFGGLDIREGDAAISAIGSLRAEGLFVYLACTRHTHSRDALVDLLWDELAPSQGLNNLRWLLSLLRRQFAPYLNITRSTVAFALDSPYWLDFSACEKLLNSAEAAPNRADQLDPAVAKELAAAVALYKGPFLSGFYLRDAPRFEEWLLGEQERLQQRIVTALQRLVADSLSRNDSAAGLGHARRLVGLDPLNESGQRQLLRLLAATNDPRAALDQFTQFERLLSTELGLTPEAATLDLVAEIRAVSQRPQPLAIQATVAARHEALPHYFDPFVGREEEQAELRALLADAAVRLITLHGQGGLGKTRLAVEAAKTVTGFADGVYFVPLDNIDRADLIVPTIAEALDFPLQGSLDPLRQLSAYLYQRQVLLILDNFEQLVQSADQLLRLIGAAQGVKLLVTSQARLDLAAEVVVSLEGLAVPLAESTGDAANYAATRLFVERSRRVASRFVLDEESTAAVVQIIRLTEGLPLAIELAAARLRDESASLIASSLAADIDRLQTTRRDVPPRQRSLRAVFDRSSNLLEAQARLNLGALAVFRGAFGLAAAAAVLEIETASVETILHDLIERSLLRAVHEQQYQMHGLLRGFALEALDPAQEAGARQRHTSFYLQRSEIAAAKLAGVEQADWLDLLTGDFDEIRTALDFALLWNPAIVLRIAVALLDFWLRHGESSIGREYLEKAMALSPEVDTELRARALLALGRLAVSLGDYSTATTWLDRALTLAASAADEEWSRQVTAWGLCYSSTVAVQSSAFARAVDLSSQGLALFRALDDQPGIVFALSSLGLSQRDNGEFAAAGVTLNNALQLARQLGHQSDIARALRHLGTLALYVGNFKQAIDLLQEAATILEQLKDLANIADVQSYLGLAELGRGNTLVAEMWGHQSLELARRLRSRFVTASALFVLGGAALFQGKFFEATTFAQDALARHQAMNFEPFVMRGLEHLAAIFAQQGDVRRATRLAGAAAAWCAARGERLDPGYSALHNQTIALVRASLSEQKFALLWAEGQHLTLDYAVAEALATPRARGQFIGSESG